MIDIKTLRAGDFVMISRDCPNEILRGIFATVTRVDLNANLVILDDKNYPYIKARPSHLVRPISTQLDNKKL